MLGCTELLRSRFAGVLTITCATSCRIGRRLVFGEKLRSIFGLLLGFLEQCAHCICPPDHEFLWFKPSAYFLCALIYLRYLHCMFALRESDLADATHASERPYPFTYFYYTSCSVHIPSGFLHERVTSEFHVVRHTVCI